MALALGVKKGGKIRIGIDVLTVKEIISLEKIIILVHGQQWTITDLESQEVLPRVRISCGVTPDKELHPYAKLLIEAPREIDIERLH